MDRVAEWKRLILLADRYEPTFRKWFMTAARGRHPVNTLKIRGAFTSLVDEVASSTAVVYEMGHNPNDVSYPRLVNRLVDGYSLLMERSYNSSRNSVRLMLPRGLPLHEVRARLDDTFGLDERGAKALEKYRQQLHASPRPYRPKAIADSIKRSRNEFLVQRSNALARTEVQRAINLTIEMVWLENKDPVSKAVVYLPAEDPATNPEVFVDNPQGRRKEWLTRQDGRVCDYCEPMSGITARLGQDFDTPYGFFLVPPAHPNCRCFVVLV